jgi:hypothetical protein
MKTDTVASNIKDLIKLLNGKSKSDIVKDWSPYQDKEGNWKPDFIQQPYLKDGFEKQMSSLLPNLASKFRFFGNPDILVLKVAPKEAWSTTDQGSLIYMRHVEEPDNLKGEDAMDKVVSWMMANLVMAKQTCQSLLPLMNTITTVGEIRSWFERTQPGSALNDRHIPAFLGKRPSGPQNSGATSSSKSYPG